MALLSACASMLAHKLQANIEHSKIEIWEHGT
jgi:hypothetical protein